MAENYDEKTAGEDAAFLEQVAAPLRAVEYAHPSFEKRLMERVQIEGPTLYPVRRLSHASWWREQRVLRISPLTGKPASRSPGFTIPIMPKRKSWPANGV